MSRKIFVDNGILDQNAYFGWQDKGQCLFGLKEGYKNSADELVGIALEKGSQGDIYTLDTYIFPVVFSYRHCIEISLKQIYLRCTGKIPTGGHDLLVLWDKVKDEVIDSMINSEEFLKEVKKYKTNFIQFNLNGIDLNEIRNLIKELQGVDNKADVWRYLISKDDKLIFTDWKQVDYAVIKDTITYLYGVLDYIHTIADEYLTS